MPLTLAGLAKRRASTQFEYAGEAVALDYYPAAITPAMVEAVQAWQERANAPDADGDALIAAFAAWYCGIIADWSLLEAEGGPTVAVTPERITRLINEMPMAMDFMAECLRAAIEAMSLGKPSGTASPSPSASTPPQTANAVKRPRRGSPTSH